MLGGTHLGPQSAEQVQESVAALKRLAPELIGTTHCTGMVANARIVSALPEQFRVCTAGTVLELA